jgi:hypothetical protein
LSLVDNGGVAAVRSTTAPSRKGTAMKTALLLTSVLAMFLAAAVGCSSKHASGVKSDYHSQWTKVAANTQTTTEAAKAVLEAHALKEITATSTADDGVAKGKMADGTKVSVDVKKIDAGSEVSVTIGTLGDPKMGAQIASEIKTKAEAK